MSAPCTMIKEYMAAGLAAGRTLIQEEWAHPDEIAWVDELVAEGRASATPWEYRDGYQCERRRVSGTEASRLALSQDTKVQS